MEDKNRDTIWAGNHRIGFCPICNAKGRTVIINGDSRFCLACGAEAKRGEWRIPKTTDRDDPKPFVSDERKRALCAVNETAARYFRAFLSKDKKAQKYLESRNLEKETIRSFGIGFAGWGNEPLLKVLQKEGFTEEDAIDSGLYCRNEDGTAWFRFQGRLMFPIRNENGNTIGFSGRVIDDREPKYKNSPDTEVFSKRENLFGFDRALRSDKNCLIICEGQMDVIRLHEAGFTNAVASLGTALTDVQVQKMISFAKTIILMYDSDTAGVTAARRAIEKLVPMGADVYVSILTPCKDPDEFIKAFGSERMKERIRRSLPWQEFLIRNAKQEDGTPDFNRITEILLEGNERGGKEGTKKLLCRMNAVWK